MSFKPARSSGLLALALAGSPLVPAATTNWPAWRGPDMTALAEEADLPVTFSETTNLRWKVENPGKGESTPVIWGHRLFLLSASPVGTAFGTPPSPGSGPFGIRTPSAPFRFEVLCLDRHSGRILWRKTVREETPHEGHHPDHGFASYSPVTDGKRLWAFFGSRGLHCLSLDGELLWSVNLGKMTTRNSFGEGSSPALTEKAVVVLMDQEKDSSLAAVDKEKGTILWRKPRDEVSSWTTPFVVSHKGKAQVVVNGSNRTRSYDPETGDVLWQCGGQTINVIPTPVAGFGLVFCASGFRGNAVQAITLDRTGELTGTDAVRWEIKRGTPYVPSPLLYGRRLYFYDGNAARLSCVDAESGRVHYTGQTIEGLGNVYASPIGAGGRLYLAGRNGAVAVVKDGEAFELLALNRFDDGFDASPAVAGNDLYLRGKRNLYCIRKP